MKRIKASVLVCLFTAALLVSAAAPKAQSLDPNPPDEVVKLIFIHHSTGENWLTDGYGNLGKELGENNYFVSDTNYGWGPDSIGDRTDIPNWLECRQRRDARLHGGLVQRKRAAFRLHAQPG